MKKSILLIAILGILSSAFAEDFEKGSNKGTNPSPTVTIKGQVTDKETGEALTGAFIQLEGTDLNTYTDFEGSFTFNSLKQCTYTAIVSYISYEKTKIKIETTEQIDVLIELTPASVK